MSDAKRPITVVVADDHPVVLHGVSTLLDSEVDIKVVAACSNGAAALTAIRNLTPDLAVLDISMPGVTGITILKAVAAENLKTRIVILTASAADSQILEAVASGVAGILLKDTGPDHLVECLRQVASGRRWLPADLVDEAVRRETGRRSNGERLGRILTRREREVMLMVAEGRSNKEVGRRLGLSEGTVKIHLHRIYQKIGVSNRTALAALALAHRDELIGGGQ